MARQIKNNAEYFTHDADMRNDVKVKALRRRFSHKGYAIWCFILEVLTDSDFFEIPFDEINQELLAADFDSSTEELKDVVEYCCRIGLLQRSDDGLKVYSEAHQARFSSLIIKREKERKRIANYRRENTKNTELSQDCCSNNTEKEECTELSQDCCSNNPYNREEKSRVEKSRVKNIYPYQDIVQLWNSSCVNLPSVRSMTEGRKNKIKKRLSEFGDDPEKQMQVVRDLFREISESDFLNGGNKNNWQATFDWVFTNSSNWVKILEGNYRNKKTATNHQSNLGPGEFINAQGQRTYGTGKVILPDNAPPRPSDKYAWSNSLKNWVLF